MGLHGLLEDELPLAPLQLQVGGQAGRPFDEGMIQQGYAHLQGMRHAGPVDLGQDVARQVGLEIGILHAVQVMPRRRFRHEALYHLHGVIALQLRAKPRRVEAEAQAVGQDRDAVEVGLGAVTRQRLQGRLGAQRPRCPIELGVDPAGEAEQRAPEAVGQAGPKQLLVVMPAVAPIAGEDLVAAVARKRHRDPLARQAADLVGRNRRTVGEGLVVDVGQAVDQLEGVGLHHLHVVLGPEGLGDLPGIGRFVEAGLGEADRAGIDRLAGQPGHRRDHGAGIDPARKEGAQRDVGDHPEVDRLAQLRDQFLLQVVRRGLGLRLEGHVPVGARPRCRPAFSGLHDMAGRQLGDAAVDRLRVRDVAIGEVVLDGLVVEVAPQARMHQEGLQLRGEEDRAVRQLRVVERLDAQAVAGQEQHPLPFVPEAEGEHAAEAIDAAFAPFLPGVDDHLGIAMRPEDVAFRLKLPRQFLEVVDLAVVDDDDRAILVEERLLAGGQIDDREPAVAEADARGDVEARIVGSAMAQAVVHPLEQGPVYGPLVHAIKDADDSAHGARSFDQTIVASDHRRRAGPGRLCRRFSLRWSIRPDPWRYRALWCLRSPGGGAARGRSRRRTSGSWD